MVNILNSLMEKYEFYKSRGNGNKAKRYYSMIMSELNGSPDGTWRSGSNIVSMRGSSKKSYERSKKSHHLVDVLKWPILVLVGAFLVVVVWYWRRIMNILNIVSEMSRDENMHMMNEMKWLVRKSNMLRTSGSKLNFVSDTTRYKDVLFAYDYLDCGVKDDVRGSCVDCVRSIFESLNKSSLTDEEMDILKYDFFYESKGKKDLFEKIIKNAKSFTTLIRDRSLTPVIYFVRRRISSSEIELEDIFDNSVQKRVQVRDFLSKYKGVLTLLYDKKVDTRRRIPNSVEYRFIMNKFSSKVFSVVREEKGRMVVSVSKNFGDTSVRLLRVESLLSMIFKFGLGGSMAIVENVDAKGFVFGERYSLFIDSKTREVLFHIIRSYM